MKRAALPCLLLLASSSALHAAVDPSIHLLSQSYATSGSWTETWYTSTGQLYPLGDWSAGYTPSATGALSGSYAASSSDGTPVGGSFTSPSPIPAGSLGSVPLTASTSINLFSTHIQADAIKNQWTYPTGQNFSGYIETSVDAHWLFSPVGNQLHTYANVTNSVSYTSQFGSFTATLTDVTTGQTLFSISPAPNSPAWSTWIFNNLTVIPGNPYDLHISGWSHTFDADHCTQSVTFDLSSTPVPEPATLLPLAAALALPLLRRRT